MADDFADLLSGEGAKPNEEGQEGAGVGDLLGSLLGGGGSGESGGLGSLLGGLMGGDAGSQSGGPGDMTDLLGNLMGGGASPPSSASGGTGDMTDLLGSLLGGGSAGGGQPAGGSADLLGSLLGGGGASSSAGLGGLLGGLLGGGSAGQMSFGGGGGVSLPFVGTLAKKLGISEQMANMLVMGAIGLLTSSAAKNRGATRSGEIDYNSLTDPDFIHSSGVSKQLAVQMGVSEDEAIRGLQQTINLMAAGNQPAPRKAAAKKKTAKTSGGSTKKAAGPKKSSATVTKTTPKKKATQKDADKKESGSDFMELLDDLTN